LSFWSGLFIWGGPTAYSIGVFLNLYGTLIIYKEAVSNNHKTLLLGLVQVLAVLSHPFIVLYCFITLFCRFLYVINERKSTIIIFIILLLYSLLISKDNPESYSFASLLQETTLIPDIFSRLYEIINIEISFAYILFGDIDNYYFYRFYTLFKNLIILLGFFNSIFIIFYFNKLKIELKLLTIQTIIYFFSFLFCPTIDYAAFLPQRNFLAISTLSFVSGIVLTRFLILNNSFTKFYNYEFIFKKIKIKFDYILIFLFFITSLLMQKEIFYGKSKIIDKQFSSIKSYLIENSRDSVISYFRKTERPFYYMHVFLYLFSDKDIINSNIYIITFWHEQLRHNVRFFDNKQFLYSKKYYLYLDDNKDLALKLIEEEKINTYKMPMEMKYSR
jgi:hypothetical protein